jgi:hypothetical protein
LAAASKQAREMTMMISARSMSLAAVCLLAAAGCVTDKPVSYEDHALSQKQMKAFAGTYQVENWPGNVKPDLVKVTEVDRGLQFAYSLPDQQVEARFQLYKIPGSEKNLHLLSLPAQEDTNQANMFFIGRKQDDQTQIWAVFGNMPVAQDHLQFTEGKAKAEDVQRFLRQKADAFVAANEPQVVLKKK